MSEDNKEIVDATEIEKTVFDNLYDVNVKKYLQQKGKFDYLSWATAWALACKHDSDATYQDGELVTFPDGTCMVTVTVTMFGKSLTARMPIIDFKNKPVVNPNSMDINTAYQRCLAKAVALHGISLSVYQGEDIAALFESDNNQEKIDAEQVKKLLSLIDMKDSDAKKLCVYYKVNGLPDLTVDQYNHATKALKDKPDANS